MIARKAKPPSAPDDPEQSKRFIDMARELGADESPEAFNRAFKDVVLSRKSKPRAGHPHPSAKRSSS
jgi:hypothetical protein